VIDVLVFFFFLLLLFVSLAGGALSCFFFSTDKAPLMFSVMFRPVIITAVPYAEHVYFKSMVDERLYVYAVFFFLS
jgi:hypothetical protein